MSLLVTDPSIGTFCDLSTASVFAACARAATERAAPDDKDDETAFRAFAGAEVAAGLRKKSMDSGSSLDSMLVASSGYI